MCIAMNLMIVLQGIAALLYFAVAVFDAAADVDAVDAVDAVDVADADADADVSFDVVASELFDVSFVCCLNDRYQLGNYVALLVIAIVIVDVASNH
jgi:hypothetical protein